MDSKTRVMKSLSYQAADRIARHDEFWPEFRDAAVRELGLNEDASLEEHFGIDIHIAVPDETPFPSRACIISDDGERLTERNGYGSVVRKKKGGWFFEFVEPAIASVRDWDALVFEPATLDRRYATWQTEVEEAKAKGLCVFGKIGGPYIRTGFVRGEAEWLMDIAADPGFAREAAARYGEHLLGIGLEELRRGRLHDTGIWIFDDMGSNHGPIMSPLSFEKIFLPAYRSIVQGLKRSGAAKVGLHSDGDIRPLLDMLIDAGIDLINPVEPKANMSVPALMRKYGRRLAYVGGMCNSLVLPSGDRKAIHRQITELIEAGREGGVVIGAHSIGPDISVASYRYYHDTVLAQGRL